MTSTTYSKSNFKHGLSVFLWTLRNNVAVIVVYLSLIAFDAVTSSVFGLIFSGTDESRSLHDFARQLAAGSMVSGSFRYALIIGFVLCIRSFSYLHNKRRTDMFGSLPVSRRTMYFSRLLSSFIISAVPMIIVCLIVAVFVTNNINFGAEIIGVNFNLFEYTLRLTLILFSYISLFGLLSICCGRTVDKIISFFAINLGAPVVMLLLMVLPALLVMGYHIDINWYWVVFLSPLFSVFSFDIFYWLIFCAAALAGSFFLVKNRKAECAQSHFAYKLPMVAVKIIVSFSAGVVTGMLFALIAVITYSKRGDIALFWVGMLLGSFVAYTIIQLIFAKGFKGFLKGLIPYGAMILCFALYFTSLSTGFFGYESYVPNINEVKSVSFNSDQKLYINGVNILEHEITDKKIIKKTIDAHKQELKDAKPIYNKANMFNRANVGINQNDTNAYDSVFEQYTINGDNNFTITYTLNDGRKISRAYNNYYQLPNDDESLDGVISIDFLDTFDYKENVSPLFICDKKYLTDVDINYETEDDSDEDYDDENYTTVKTKKALKLYDTLMKDYKKHGFISESDNFSYYSLTFYFGDKSSELNNTEAYFDVPSNYKETLKLLKKYSI